MSRFWMDDEPQQKSWTLQDIYDDLGTKTDVAAALDITVWRMEAWLRRRERIKCPMPIRRFGPVDVYSIAEWRAWFERWRANPRRAKWMEDTKPNGAGLPFFALNGPDRGMASRKKPKSSAVPAPVAEQERDDEAEPGDNHPHHQ